MSALLTGQIKVNYFEFTPFANLISEPIVFMVRAESPITSGKNLAQRIKTDPANRKFKPPFSLTATILPARQAVNRMGFGENLLLSMIIRTPHRPGAAHFYAV